MPLRLPNLNKLFRRLSIRAKLQIAFVLLAAVPLGAVASLATVVTGTQLRRGGAGHGRQGATGCPPSPGLPRPAGRPVPGQGHWTGPSPQLPAPPAGPGGSFRERGWGLL